jgi:hypothetical protein
MSTGTRLLSNSQGSFFKVEEKHLISLGTMSMAHHEDSRLSILTVDSHAMGMEDAVIAGHGNARDIAREYIQEKESAPADSIRRQRKFAPFRHSPLFEERSVVRRGE